MDNNSTILNSIRKVNVFPTVSITTDDFVIDGVTYEANLTVQQIIACLQGRAKVYQIFEDGTTGQITLSNIQDDIEAEYLKQKEEALKLKHEYATFKIKEKEYLERIEELEKDLADVSTEGMEALRVQLAEAEEKIAQLSKTIEELNASIEEKDNTISDLENQIAELQSTIEEKDQNISELTVQLATANSELATTKETLQNTTEQLATATSELGSTRGQLSNALSQVESLTQQLSDKEQELEETKEQLQTAQELIASLNEQISDLEEQVAELQEDLDTANEIIEQLENDKKEIIANSFRKVTKEDIIFGLDSMSLTEVGGNESPVNVDPEYLLTSYVDKGFSYNVDDTNKLNLVATGDISDVNSKIAYLIKLKEPCAAFAEDSSGSDEQLVKDDEGNKYLLEFIDVGAELSNVVTVVSASFNNDQAEIADRVLLIATFKAN